MGSPSATAKTVFLEALEIASNHERQALLESRFGGNAELRRAVEELLRHHEQINGFLETPPTAVADLADTAREAHATTAPTLSFLSPAQRSGSLGRLGHYEILEVIGSGGFGVVLKAHDENLQRVVAIKSLAESLAASATARKRFVREAQAAAAVRHDNVVGIYAVEAESPVPYLVMELVDGVSLEEKLQQDGPLELEEVLRISVQVADGLAAAHKQGLVHRDVKPANILLENGVQRVKITDFGLARAVDDSSLTQTGLIAGTPSYMSPEQARGEAVDARSDLFSLGSVLYVSCTGRVPFAASSSLAVAKKVCEETPRPIADINPAIPPWLAEIVERLHAKDLARRFQSADEVAACLRGGHANSITWRSQRAYFNRRAAIAGLIATAIGTGGLAWSLGWLQIGGPRRQPSAAVGASSAAPVPSPARPPIASLPRVLIILAPQDFFYPEYGPVRTRAEAQAVTCQVASTTLNECQPNELSPQIPVKPDLLLSEARAANYSAIYFCGGQGIETFTAGGSHADEARRRIEEALAAARTVSAMGIGAVVVAEAGALRDKQATCSPFGSPPGVYVKRLKAAGAVWQDQPVVEDGLVLTGRQPADINQFIRTLLKRLGIEPQSRPPPSSD